MHNLLALLGTSQDAGSILEVDAHRSGQIGVNLKESDSRAS